VIVPALLDVGVPHRARRARAAWGRTQPTGNSKKSRLSGDDGRAGVDKRGEPLTGCIEELDLNR
jgi:hypothetical protein